MNLSIAIARNHSFGVRYVLNQYSPCFVSTKFGPLMIFLKRWFADNETMRGEMHEYQEEAIA